MELEVLIAQTNNKSKNVTFPRGVSVLHYYAHFRPVDAMIPQEADQTHIEYGFPVISVKFPSPQNSCLHWTIKSQDTPNPLPVPPCHRGRFGEDLPETGPVEGESHFFENDKELLRKSFEPPPPPPPHTHTFKVAPRSLRESVWTIFEWIETENFWLFPNALGSGALNR